MRCLLFLPTFLFSLCLIAKSPCLPFGGYNGILGIPPDDEPPGCIMCSGFSMGSNECATPDSIDYIPCFSVENSVWLSTCADSSGAMSITFLASNCLIDKGMELAVYDENLNNLECFSVENALTGNVQVFGVIPGKPYFIQIDGYEGDVCDFVLVVSGFASDSPPDAPPPLASIPDKALCIGDTVQFIGDRLYGAMFYEWDYPPFLKLIEGGNDSTFAKFVTKDFGTGIIKLTPSSICFPGAPMIKTVTTIDENLGEIFSITEPQETICIGSIVEYNITTNGLGTFNWQIPSFFELIEGGSPTDTFARFEVKNYGDGSLIVAPESCLDGFGDKMRVSVSVPMSLQFDTIQYEYCANNSIPPNDTCYSVNSGCDSCIVYDLIPISSPIWLDTVICENDCVVIGDSCYTQDARIVFENASTNGCDSVIRLEISHFKNEIKTIICTKIDGFPTIVWSHIPSADFFILDINGVIDTVSNNRITFQNLSGDTSLNVQITPVGGCTYKPFSSTCDLQISSVVDQDINDLVKVFPNPTDNELNIESLIRIENITVYDISGKVVQVEQTPNFTLKNNRNGIYLLKIKTEIGVVIKRVMVY